jgi:transketolase
LTLQNARRPDDGLDRFTRVIRHRFIGVEGTFIGMTGFGASGPAELLYKHFGITAEAVVKAAE